MNISLTPIEIIGEVFYLSSDADVVDEHRSSISIANGRIGWNETVTVLPLTSPEITTPLSELNYWRSVSFLFNLFSFHLDYKLNFSVKCFLYHKVW